MNADLITRLHHPPRTRYRYSYAIFSTSGFSKDAQEFALAHQISLVDLSMPDFANLRTLVADTAKTVHAAMDAMPAESRPKTHEIRNFLRRLLLDLPDGRAATQPSVTAPLEALASSLHSRSTLGLILAFPAAPFVLGLASDNLNAFVNYARRHPTHAVRLHRLPHTTAPHPVWQVSPQAEPDAYTLTFGLPEQVEVWIIDQDAGTPSRTRWVKQSMLSAMTVYWMAGDHAHTFQLRYEPTALRSDHESTELRSDLLS
ncbi:hypothetical protein ABZY09_45835 [Streptomyces sp. NPDC002928]|uniref:hypothetical protein n=1 Tax=Streptomyces sp. NPDC002928 TaxID=3154440 RepID=UPI0033B60C87